MRPAARDPYVRLGEAGLALYGSARVLELAALACGHEQTWAVLRAVRLLAERAPELAPLADNMALDELARLSALVLR